jgi:hypothetical protein
MSHSHRKEEWYPVTVCVTGVSEPVPISCAKHTAPSTSSRNRSFPCKPTEVRAYDRLPVTPRGHRREWEQLKCPVTTLVAHIPIISSQRTPEDGETPTKVRIGRVSLPSPAPTGLELVCTHAPQGACPSTPELRGSKAQEHPLASKHFLACLTSLWGSQSGS